MYGPEGGAGARPRLLHPVFWRAAVATLALDWGTKYAAAALLAPEVPRNALGSVLRFTFSLDLRNTFWLGIPHTPYLGVPGGTPVFYAVKVAILAVMVAMAIRAPRRLALALGILFGAGTGNTAEQILTGSVINFLDVGVGVHRWPTFNVADASLITTGIVISLVVLRDAVRERGWRGAFLTSSSPLSAPRAPDDRG